MVFNGELVVVLFWLVLVFGFGIGLGVVLCF